MTTPNPPVLIHDWALPRGEHATPAPRVQLNDETLRDGLQSPSAVDPELEAKRRILGLMDGLGIETASVGIPAAGPRHRQAAETLCREAAARRLRLRPNCGGRTLLADVEQIVEVAQRAAAPVEAFLFVASSALRQYAEGWDLDHLLRSCGEAVALAAREGLEVMLITEDTTRSSPERLRAFVEAGVGEGARRVCLCDTVGVAVPQGVSRLVSWTRQLLDDLGVEVGVDWHGHDDRGLGLANALAAIEAGATRVHATALGAGERAGNTAMEQLLVNLKLLGIRDDDLTLLPDYTAAVAAAIDVPIPAWAPIVGRDAFRTATGVHAAAIAKARRKDEPELADRVYSAFPAGWVGRRQEIEVGPQSGAWNVRWFLEERGLAADDELVRRVLEHAKRSARVLSEDEILALVRAPRHAEGRR